VNITIVIDHYCPSLVEEDASSGGQQVPLGRGLNLPRRNMSTRKRRVEKKGVEGSAKEGLGVNERLGE
jgi:hypothetical protein